MAIPLKAFPSGTMSLDHWASYYRGGAIVSCPTGPEPNYTKGIRAAWEEFFSDLADGARVLDLGTGNGAVALIGKETAARRSIDLRIVGVDLADIDPPAFVPDGPAVFEGIEFRAGVNAEDLPFEDGCFSAICGQYSLEYTQKARTLSEAARVLEPGGACRFILHHELSLVVSNARESLRQARFALHELGFLRRFRAYCDRLAENPARAEPARRRLFEAGVRLDAAARQSSNPAFPKYLLDTVTALLQHQSRLGRGEMLRQTLRFESEVRHWTQRLEDLVAAALDEDGIEDLVRLAESSGFEDIDVGTLADEGDALLGWRLTMSRR